MGSAACSGRGGTPGYHSCWATFAAHGVPFFACLNFHDLALDDLRLFHDFDANASTESLCQCLRLGHLQGKDLRPRDRCERSVRSQRLQSGFPLIKHACERHGFQHRTGQADDRSCKKTCNTPSTARALREAHNLPKKRLLAKAGACKQ